MQERLIYSIRYLTFLVQDFSNQTECLTYTSAGVSDAPSQMSTIVMLKIKSCSVEEWIDAR